MNDHETLRLIREFEAFLYGGIPEGVDTVYERDAHPFSESHSRGEASGHISDPQAHPRRLVVGRIEYDASTQEERMILSLPEE
jgi:hypothetical protein